VAAPLRVLGAGFHSLVVETGDGIVFRVAKNREATAGHAREAALLPALRARLPLVIPDPRWYTGPSALFPFGVIGYRKVPGMPLEPSRLMGADTSVLAAALGAFLHALHSFPAQEALALGCPGPDVQRGHLEQVRTTVLPPLRAALSAGEYRKPRRLRSLDFYPRLGLSGPDGSHGILPPAQRPRRGPGRSG
jgi:aminoglycoside phosphotransferase (APT) family kinase protein